MTPEEMEAKILELETKNQTLTQDNERLATNEKNQNSYITKLEEKVKKGDQTPNPTSVNLQDKRLAQYLERNMRRDTIEEATGIIKTNVSAEVYNCLEKELMAFLDKYMTIDKTQTSYVIDAFNLIYGQAMSNKEHPIHKLGQASQENGPAATTVTNNVAQNTAAQQTVVTNVSDQLRAFMGGVPTMTPNDTNAVQTPPVNNPNPIHNTKDALKAFKDRVREAGANRFS